MVDISPGKKWLSPQEAAAYLGLKRSTIYAYVCSRRIPYYKRGHFVRFLVSELDEWMIESRVPTEAEVLREILSEE